MSEKLSKTEKRDAKELDQAKRGIEMLGDWQKNAEMTRGMVGESITEANIAGLEAKKEALRAELTKKGMAKLNVLAQERERHAIMRLLGDEKSLYTLVEMEQKARRIVQDHDLSPEHLEPFLVPDLSQEILDLQAEKKASAMPDLEKGIRITEKAPQGKGSWLKKTFGIKSKEEKEQIRKEADRDQTLLTIGKWTERYEELKFLMANSPSDTVKDLEPVLESFKSQVHAAELRLDPKDRTRENLGILYDFLDDNEKPKTRPGPEGKDEYYNPSGFKKETRWEKIKRAGRKIFLGTVFTASALPTSDTRLPKEPAYTPKTETVHQAPLPQTAHTPAGKTDATIFSKTHAARESDKKFPTRHTADTIAHITPAPTTVLETPISDSGILQQVEIPTDTIAATPKTDTVEIRSTRTNDTIPSLETSAPVPLKLTPAESRAKMMEMIKTFDTAEKKSENAPKEQGYGAPREEKVTPFPTAPVSPVAPEKESDVKFERQVTSSPGIKVTYQNADGTPLDTNAFGKISEATGLATPIPSSENYLGNPSENYQRAHPDSAPIQRSGHFPVAAPKGYIESPIGERVMRSKNVADKFEIPDPYVRVENGYIVPRFLWEKMDPVVWNTLARTPGALNVYMENTTKEGPHTPYVILVWEGTTATEYLIGKNDLLVAEPKKHTLGEQPLLGRFTVRVENKSGQSETYTLTGTGAQNYKTLDALDKQVVALAAAQSGEKELLMYSIDGRGRPDGTVQTFDTKGMLVSQVKDTLEQKIQDEVYALRKEKRIPLHLVEDISTVDREGNKIRRRQWLPNEIHRAKPKVKELKKKPLGKSSNKGIAGRTKKSQNKNKRIIYDYSQEERRNQ